MAVQRVELIESVLMLVFDHLLNTYSFQREIVLIVMNSMRVLEGRIQAANLFWFLKMTRAILVLVNLPCAVIVMEQEELLHLMFKGNSRKSMLTLYMNTMTDIALVTKKWNRDRQATT